MCFPGSGPFIFTNMKICYICPSPRPFVSRTALGLAHWSNLCYVSEQLLEEKDWELYLAYYSAILQTVSDYNILYMRLKELGDNNIWQTSCAASWALWNRI